MPHEYVSVKKEWSKSLIKVACLQLNQTPFTHLITYTLSKVKKKTSKK